MRGILWRVWMRSKHSSSGLISEISCSCVSRSSKLRMNYIV